VQASLAHHGLDDGRGGRGTGGGRREVVAHAVVLVRGVARGGGHGAAALGRVEAGAAAGHRRSGRVPGAARQAHHAHLHLG